MAYADRDEVERIREDVDIHSQKLAQCRLEEHKKDHDVLTALGERYSFINDKVVHMTETQLNLVNQINETAGSLNMVAEKVAILNNDKRSRNKYMMAILIGVIISIMSGVLMIWITFTFFKLNETGFDGRSKQMQMIMQKLDMMEQQYKK
jgi:flagellar basal body-associated protein FliL